MTAAKLLRGLDKAATAGPWNFDEPGNWHGLAARIATAENMGQIIGQIGLKAWGRKTSLGSARLICTTRNLLPLLAELVEAFGDYVDPEKEDDVDANYQRVERAYDALNAAAAKEVGK